MPSIILDRAAHDPIVVRAIMNFPNDESLRKGYVAIHRTDVELSDAKDNDRIEVEAATLRLLRDCAFLQRLKKAEVASIKAGIVAGDMLAALYLMHRFPAVKEFAEPSIKKAVHVARVFAKTERYGDDTRMNVSEAMIRDCWSRFKPVAHLWAAFRLNQAYSFTAERTVFSSGFQVFLEVAAELFRFGCTFVPLRAQPEKSILDSDDCWILPSEVQPRILPMDSLPDRLREILKSYEAPWR